MEAITEANKAARVLGLLQYNIEIFLGQREMEDLRNTTYIEAPIDFDPIKYWSDRLGIIRETPYNSHLFIHLN